MRVLSLKLQSLEAEAVRAALKAVLKDPQTAKMIYASGAERRAAKRAAKKLEWASMGGADQ